MNNYAKNLILSLNAIESLKKLGMLSLQTGRRVLGDPETANSLVEQASKVSKLFRSPFEIPSGDVDGPFKLGLTEKGKAIGMDVVENNHLELNE